MEYSVDVNSLVRVNLFKFYVLIINTPFNPVFLPFFLLVRTLLNLSQHILKVVTSQVKERQNTTHRKETWSIHF